MIHILAVRVPGKREMGVAGFEPATSGFAGKQSVLLYVPVNDPFFVITPLYLLSYTPTRFSKRIPNELESEAGFQPTYSQVNCPGALKH